tara:strand:- start:12419 stop:13114 length:696 start_codon:yes stop_codon:yes gene_type:complete
MKKITALFVLASTLCFSQNFENATITYVVSLKPPMELTKLKEEAKTNAQLQEVLWLYEDAIDVVSTLKFTKKEAIYSVEDHLRNESEKKTILTYIGAGSEKVYYSDQDELFTAGSSRGENLRIIQEKKEWELLKDSKKIGKYTCYKAVNNNSASKIKPIAWYTLEIPLPFGPKDFEGLPGVILALELDKYVFNATTITLNSSDFAPIEKPTRGKKITYAEWREKAKGVFEN